MLNKGQETLIVAVAWLCFMGLVGSVFFWLMSRVSEAYDGRVLQWWFVCIMFAVLCWTFAIDAWSGLMSCYRRYLQPRILKAE